MASTITNMKVTNPLKGLVSKRRKRYTQDGFNLDLTYIRKNIIAMGFPADRLEGVYRNHIDDVVKFLDAKHKDHYKIYNLCSEPNRSYDSRRFQERVAKYPFADHNPPEFEDIKPFCDDVHDWLSRDDLNVAAVHCKAGKGRTGVMICCYMIHAKQFPNADEALNYYGLTRTTDRKGVTIPSQRRYVNYYATLVKENLKYVPVVVVLREIRVQPLPLVFNGTQGCFQVVISEGPKKIFSYEYEVKKGCSSITIPIEKCPFVQGDIKVDCFCICKPKVLRKEKFHFWFNTFFVQEEVKHNCENGNANHNHMVNHHPESLSERSLSCDERTSNSHHHGNFRASSLLDFESDSKLLELTVNKYDLDDAHKDKTNKIYPADFRVVVFMSRLGDARLWKRKENVEVKVAEARQTRSESSEADSTESSTADDEEDGWESGWKAEETCKS